MSGEMLFAPDELKKSTDIRRQKVASYLDRLNELAMQDASGAQILNREQQLDLLLFEAIVDGVIDGADPNTVQIAENIHRRMEHLEEREQRKS